MQERKRQNYQEIISIEEYLRKRKKMNEEKKGKSENRKESSPVLMAELYM